MQPVKNRSESGFLPTSPPGPLNHILNSLEEDEIHTLRMSPFGKIVDIAEKPGFSGRFARYILSRQIKSGEKTRSLVSVCWVID